MSQEEEMMLIRGAASASATYYLKLVEDGVPSEVAKDLTIGFITATMNAGVFRSKLEQDRKPPWEEKG